MRRQLNKHRFNDDYIEAVLSKLREQGLVDDTAFARFWKDNRQSFSPRSQYLTGLELRQKGVPGEIIEQVVSTIDDDDNAYRAAKSRTRSLKTSDYHGFRHRLGEYLRRRGFNYGVISRTIERLWQEREAF
jgi:regulatory protein